uniref:CD37 molecule n=1 Tax=Piliocolobus tephrosceles TaxID=591936 RepID=A0A8C9HYC5_9PRIM
MSAQESCLSLIKYFLFVFNLFFFVLGSLIFCFGIWILIDKTSFVSFVGLAFMPLQIWSKVLAISGVFTMGLALLGCVGALKELRCLLGLYFGMLLLLFATQITLGILISTQRAQLERSLQDMVEKTIQKYRTNPEETAAEESWDYVQFQLRCCGWHSPQDWFQVLILRAQQAWTAGAVQTQHRHLRGPCKQPHLPRGLRAEPPEVAAQQPYFHSGHLPGRRPTRARVHDALDIPVQKPGPRLQPARSIPLGPALPKVPPRPVTCAGHFPAACKYLFNPQFA